MNLHVLTSPQAKAQGVIGRAAMAPDELFLFADVAEGDGFHMRGCRFPLSIAFLDRNFGILDIQALQPETSQASAPPKTALAVEASADYFENNELRPGDWWKKLALYVQSKGSNLI